MMPASRIPRITPLTAGLPMKAARSGPPSMTASPVTSTRNSTIRTTKRCGPRMLRRSGCGAAASRSAMRVRNRCWGTTRSRRGRADPRLPDERSLHRGSYSSMRCREQARRYRRERGEGSRWRWKETPKSAPRTALAPALCRGLGRPQRLLDQRRERQMEVAVGGQHIPARHHRLSAGQIADEAAGLAHQQQPRGDIPRGQLELPKAVITPRCDIGEIERRRTEPAHPAGRGHDTRERRDIDRVVAVSAKREAGADQRLAKRAPGRHPEAAVVEIGADAFLGPEHLVPGRLVDQPGYDLAIAFERDRDREMRDPMQEIGGAVERVDDPAVMWIGSRGRAAFLKQETVAGTGAQQFGLQRALGAQIGGRDEIARALDRDLELLNLAEIAVEGARRLERGVGHDVDNR